MKAKYWYFAWILGAFWACGSVEQQEQGQEQVLSFEPNDSSLQQHQLPKWFDDAKLGIFIHWGPAAVPGWAPNTHSLENVDFTNPEDWKEWFKNCAYSGWYYNSLRVPGNPTLDYHRENFGEEFSYFDFGNEFTKEVESWNPAEWANLFAEAGARYVVLTSKHHDGYLLWPSETPNPFYKDYFSTRDLVGELGDAVRAKDMRYGLYYSTGIDWTFNDRVVKEFEDLLHVVPQGEDYVQYLDTHLRELMDRYEPSVLWADIGSPQNFDARKLIADYYNAFPEGVVNNRFELGGASQTGEMQSPLHADFNTPEYAVFPDIQEKKWESTRGMAYAFFFNRNEKEENYLKPSELIHMFIDIVSKNGNLLLNVGPRPDGSIPDFQVKRLQALGEWLSNYGEGIYESRPWERAEGRTENGLPIRFTSKSGKLYCYFLGMPKEEQVILLDVFPEEGATITLINGKEALEWESLDKGLRVKVPKPKDGWGAAWGIRIDPLP